MDKIKIEIEIEENTYTIKASLNDKQCVIGRDQIETGRWRGRRKATEVEEEIMGVFESEDVMESLDDIGNRCIDIHRAIFG